MALMNDQVSLTTGQDANVNKTYVRKSSNGQLSSTIYSYNSHSGRESSSKQSVDMNTAPIRMVSQPNRAVLQHQESSFQKALNYFHQGPHQVVAEPLAVIFCTWGQDLTVPGRLTKCLIRFDGDTVEQQSIINLASVATRADPIPLECLLQAFNARIEEESKNGAASRLSPKDILQIAETISVLGLHKMRSSSHLSPTRKLPSREQSYQVDQQRQIESQPVQFRSMFNPNAPLIGLTSIAYPNTSQQNQAYFPPQPQGYRNPAMLERGSSHFIPSQQVNHAHAQIHHPLQVNNDATIGIDTLWPLIEVKVDEKLAERVAEQTEAQQSNLQESLGNLKDQIREEITLSINQNLDNRVSEIVEEQSNKKVKQETVKEIAEENFKKLKHDLKGDLVPQIDEAVKRSTNEEVSRQIGPEFKEEVVQRLLRELPADVLARLAEQRLSISLHETHSSETLDTSGQFHVTQPMEETRDLISLPRQILRTDIAHAVPAVKDEDSPVEVPRPQKRRISEAESLRPEKRTKLQSNTRAGNRGWHRYAPSNDRGPPLPPIPDVVWPFERAWSETRRYYNGVLKLVATEEPGFNLYVETNDPINGSRQRDFVCRVHNITKVCYSPGKISFSITATWKHSFYLAGLDTHDVVRELDTVRALSVSSLTDEEMESSFIHWHDKYTKYKC